MLHLLLLRPDKDLGEPEGEISQDKVPEIDHHPEPILAQAASPVPIHVDPTTIEGFIPEFMRVNGNYRGEC